MIEEVEPLAAVLLASTPGRLSPGLLRATALCRHGDRALRPLFSDCHFCLRGSPFRFRPRNALALRRGRPAARRSCSRAFGKVLPHRLEIVLLPATQLVTGLLIGHVAVHETHQGTIAGFFER